MAAVAAGRGREVRAVQAAAVVVVGAAPAAQMVGHTDLTTCDKRLGNLYTESYTLTLTYVHTQYTHTKRREFFPLEREHEPDVCDLVFHGRHRVGPSTD